MVVLALALAGVLGTVSAASAFSVYLTDFHGKYGTGGTALNTCSLCHAGPDPTTTVAHRPRNAYGSAFAGQPHGTTPQNLAAFDAIQSADSDLDGFSNLAEINVRTFPGSAGSQPVTLTVQKQGAGGGTVSGGAISCGSTCSAVLAPGAFVSLAAAPAGGSTFSGWSGGGCSGTGGCNVTVNASTTITATFDLQAVTLTVQKAGLGSGTVTGGPIACGAMCSAPVTPGSLVTLSAAAAPGSAFAGWSGGGCSGTGDCSVTVAASTTVTATFDLLVSVTVQKAGTGSGTVSGGPIACGATCGAQVPSGSGLALSAVAAPGSVFAGWSGGGCSGTGQCSLILTGDVTVTATFTATAQPVLTVQKAGTGSGTVSGGPIACGSACTAPVAPGTLVTLNAAPDPGSLFAGWSGGGCGGTGACAVTVTASVTVTATFVAATPTALVAAVLPTSRSVQVGAVATAFVTIINTGANTAFGVGIALDTAIPATLQYRTTDPLTNQVTGSLNTPVDIPAGGLQTYVIAITPTAPFAPTDVAFRFAGANTAPVAPILGVNTLLLSASAAPVADVVAIALTPTADGVVHVPNATREAAFVVATVNVGAPATVTVLANTAAAVLPLSIGVCRTDPITSVCLDPEAATAVTAIGAGETHTFAVFVRTTGDIAFDPAVHRIFVAFVVDGVVRGLTSVAVLTE